MRITQIYTKNKELYDSEQFIVELEDEGGGEFLVIRDAGTGDKLRVNFEEWEELDNAFKFLMKSL